MSSRWSNDWEHLFLPSPSEYVAPIICSTEDGITWSYQNALLYMKYQMMQTIHKPNNTKSNIQLSEFFRAVETGHTECCITLTCHFLKRMWCLGTFTCSGRILHHNYVWLYQVFMCHSNFLQNASSSTWKQKRTNVTCKFTAGKGSLQYHVFVKQDFSYSATKKLHAAEYFLRS